MSPNLLTRIQEKIIRRLTGRLTIPVLPLVRQKAASGSPPRFIEVGLPTPKVTETVGPQPRITDLLITFTLRRHLFADQSLQCLQDAALEIISLLQEQPLQSSDFLLWVQFDASSTWKGSGNTPDSEGIDFTLGLHGEAILTDN